MKASITGAILGNLLLVLGRVHPGRRPAVREKQKFNATAALSGAAMMFLALTAMAIPDLFHALRGAARRMRCIFPMSVAISVVLLIVYALSLLFALQDARAPVRG